MALPVISVPRYPNVPKAPGVPPVQRALQVAETAIILAADAVSLLSLFAGPKWGIFDKSGNPVIVGDSVKSIAVKKGYRIADYPIEAGSFASYNKVEAPFDAQCVFTKAGGDGERAVFLATVQDAVASLNLFSVVMPEFTFASANLTSYEIEREARNGASLLTVAIGVEEVRITATSTFTSTQTPSGATPASGATVQAAPPSSEQSWAAGNGAT
jgi:hypothetical protein